MTDQEIIDLVFGNTLPVTVSMSKAGAFLLVGASQYKITERQAEIVWNAMLFPREKAARSPEVASHHCNTTGE